MKKIFLIAFILGLTFSSCEDFEGWNKDPKNPTEVSAAPLVTQAEKSLARAMSNSDVNVNIFKLFAQYWNETTYTDETNYLIRNRDQGGNFSEDLYKDVLRDLKEAAILAEADEALDPSVKAAQLGVIELISVYTWHVLVDTFGDIPYTEALLGIESLNPVYDNDAAIYDDLFDRIDAALVMLEGSATSFPDGELIFDGDTEKWKKFGNSLKLRMAVRTDDYDHTRAVTLASQAVAAGVFESEADNAAFPFEVSPPNTNEIWENLVQSGRNDFVVANTIVDIMVPLNDPRMSVYFDDNLDSYTGALYGTGITFTSATHIGDPWYQPDLEGMFLSYDEVQFLLAEAVERGLISGDAEMYYNEAVTASILYWGDTQAEADAYLAQASVAYATAAATWQEKIGVQKYIALYGRGFEAWSSWRLLDYPDTMQRPSVSELPVPRRLLYGNEDVTLNEANYLAAAQAMGGDELDSRVFWDINGIGN